MHHPTASPAETTRRPEHPAALSGPGAVGIALGLVALIVVAEYVARRGLAHSFPTIGSPVVNDMLAATLCYGLLVALTATLGSGASGAPGGWLREVLARARTALAWVGGALFLFAVILVMPLDSLLWGSVVLPSLTAPSSDTVLFANLAVPLAIVALLAVNGFVIPLAEERLWRGLIQPRLNLAWGVVPGVAVTSVLFSLKHTIVDASPGRLLALTLGGAMLGIVAYRASRTDGGEQGWQTSAVSHIVANVVATSIALAAGALA